LNGLREYLGLNRNVAVLAVSVFGLGLGEELWQAYLPKYLVALGASSVTVGVFASTKDLLDGLYQYPGGWINDRFGRKRALTFFTVLAMAGYAVYALSYHWAIAFVGLALAMAWKSGAFPATFAVIGDSLPYGKRSIAFSVQSILVRVPRVIGAPIGGLLIAAFGVVAGVKAALCATVVLALGVLITQRRAYREKAGGSIHYSQRSAAQIFREMPGGMKRLLFADCLVRIGEGIAAAFIVLFVIDVRRFSPEAFGMLYAVQQSVSIALYLPMGKLADITGRRPMVALTFLFFALFPLAVSFSYSFLAMVGAFIIGGLKEMGEPARKSMIVDFADPSQRGRAVGVYYTIRNLLVVPAGTVGGLLWRKSPNLALETAFAVGVVGVLAYLVASRGTLAAAS
jgi:MFS family permease